MVENSIEPLYTGIACPSMKSVSLVLGFSPRLFGPFLRRGGVVNAMHPSHMQIGAKEGEKSARHSEILICVSIFFSMRERRTERKKLSLQLSGSWVEA